MSSVGRDIENAIQSMLAVSEAFADMQAKVDRSNHDLNMLETLFSVSKYIGSNPELSVVLAVLSDSVKGVFGATDCTVIFPPERQQTIQVVIPEYIASYPDLLAVCDDVLHIDDVAGSDLTTLEQGELLLIKLVVGGEVYGILTVYWQYNFEASQSSLIFLRIIASQISMYLKSASLVDEFKALAIIDPLTGIYNRSYLSTIESTTKPQVGECVIIFDLDHFKRVNDTFGHQYGDSILKQFAGILQDVAEDATATAFRFGGEEFVVKTSQGFDLAHQLARTVSRRYETETGYTVSVGISTCGQSCYVNNYKQLIEVADEALYASKQMGRNRMTHATADLQVAKQAASQLINAYSDYYRNHNHYVILRTHCRDARLVDEERYNHLRFLLTNSLRMYDHVIVTPSLDAVLMVTNSSREKTFLSRLKNLLRNEFNDLNFDVHSLGSAMESLDQAFERLMPLTRILAKKIDVKTDWQNQLLLMLRWYRIGTLISTTDNQQRQGTWLSYHIIQQHTRLTVLRDEFYQYYQLKMCETSTDLPEVLHTLTQALLMLDDYDQLLSSGAQVAEYQPTFKRAVLDKLTLLDAFKESVSEYTYSEEDK